MNDDDRKESGALLALLITATASTALGVGIALVAIWWHDWSTWPWM